MKSRNMFFATLRITLFFIASLTLSACGTNNNLPTAELDFYESKNYNGGYELSYNTAGNDLTSENEAYKSGDESCDDTTKVEHSFVYGSVSFITLPNGTRVDTRVSSEIVCLVFKHFDAIENGDVVAFRETLQGQDGASMNWHLGLILDSFWDIVVGDYDKSKLFHDGNMWAGLTELGWYRVFTKEFPSVSRSAGLFVTEIRYADDGSWGGLMVALTNYYQEERFYLLGLLFDFGWPGIEWRNSVESWPGSDS